MELDFNPTAKPQHVHDCPHCTPLGPLNSFDLYHCDQGGNNPTVIARWGSEGAQYSSGMGFAGYVPELTEAKRRAVAMGLPVQRS